MTPPAPQIWNIPNILTFSRIILAMIMFAVIPFGMYWTALILFLLAAATDWLDGWWARKFNLVSQLGRIMDPLADKMVVCGAFIYLVAIPELHVVHLPFLGTWLGKFNFGLVPWMVVVIILRELVVTGLRSFVESGGGDFSAKWIGKWKMGLQCVAVPACFLFLIGGGEGNASLSVKVILALSLWATVFLTLYSGIMYIVAAIRFGYTTQDNTLD